MSPFSGSVAVVTGGGSGIGAALAHEVAVRGARVAVADIRLEAAKEIAAQIGDAARAYHVDVTDAASVEALAHDVAKDFGGVNLLFANAGVIVGGTLDETSAQDFAWMYDVNVTGLFRTVSAFLPALLAQAADGKTARIINTGSENSVGLPISGATTAYTGTKHAVLGLSDGLRRDLKDRGVAVTVFCPGIVATNLADARRTRPERYGGAYALPEEQLNWVSGFMQEHGRTPAWTALLCCEGIERGDFIIITDPRIRGLAEVRHAEVEAALDLLDRRLAESA
jgi:NAD(P)-dependent dehydrogenase (short-subunit alcohol dehydrogenase family)